MNQQWLQLGPRVGSLVEIDGRAAGVEGRIRCVVVTYDRFEEETGSNCRGDYPVIYPLKVVSWPDHEKWPASAPRFIAARQKAFRFIKW